MKLFTLMAVLTVLFAVNADARRYDGRQNKQGARIQNGVKNGSLTKREARSLARDQRSIRRMEKRAEKDGTVTNREKLRIEKKQDRANRNIYRQKHDDQSQAN